MPILLPHTIESFLECYCIDASHIPLIAKQIEKLKAEGFRLKKKRFRNKYFYSCEINIGRHYHRLIFDLITFKEHSHFILRTLVWNHDYKKGLEWSPLGEIQSLPQAILSDESQYEVQDDIRPMVERLGECYELSEIQTQVFSNLSCPALLVGPPGSGKTLLAMAFFQEQALRHKETFGHTDVLRLLYIAGTKTLCDSFYRDWQCWAKDALHETQIYLTVLTSEELLVTQGGHAHGKRDVMSTTDFNALLKEEMKRCGLRPDEKKENEIKEELYTSAHIFHLDKAREFEVSNYKKLGINQSLLRDEGERRLVYKIAQNILAQLERKGSSVLGVSTLQQVEPAYAYDFVVFDEAQNHTVQEVMNALQVAKDHNLIVMGDTLQKVGHVRSCFSLLGAVFYDKGIPLQINQLKENHRIQPEVQKLVNEVVLLMTNLKGGLLDATSYSSLDLNAAPSESPEVSVVLSRDLENDCAMLRKNARTAALVFNGSDREFMLPLMGGNVFDVREAQGMELDETYIFFSEAALAQFHMVSRAMTEKEITKDTLLLEKKNAPAEKGRVDTEAIEILSSLCVLLSRSKGVVRLYFEEVTDPTINHKVRRFLEWFKSRLDTNKVRQIEVLESSSLEWLSTIHQYIRDGKIQQACDNLKIHFHFSHEEAFAYTTRPLNEFIDNLDSVQHWREQRKNIAEAAVAGEITGKVHEEFQSVRLSLSPVSKIQEEAAVAEETNRKVPESQSVNTSPSTGSKTQLEGMPNVSNMPAKYTPPEKIRQAWAKFHSDLCKSMSNCNIRIIQTNLDIFFSERVKPEIFTDVLFIPLNGSSVFYEIIKNPFALQAFLQKIYKNPTKVPTGGWNYINPHNNMSLFYLLSYYIEEIAQTENFFVYHEIDEDTLNARLPNTDKTLENTSVVYWLCGCPKGIALLNKNPDLVSKISLEAFSARRVNTGEAEENTSAAYWLCTTPQGRALLTKNPDLLKKISSEALNAKLTRAAGASENMSVAYWLCATSEGRALLKENKDLLSKISSETLNARLPYTAGAKTNTSAAYWLCATPDGLELLNQNPDLLSKISPEALNAKRTSAAGTDENISAADLLKRTDAGRELLRKYAEMQSKNHFPGFFAEKNSEGKQDTELKVSSPVSTL